MQQPLSFFSNFSGTLDNEGKEKKGICINLSKGMEELLSVNSFYDPKKYPTLFDTVA